MNISPRKFLSMKKYQDKYNSYADKNCYFTGRIEAVKTTSGFYVYISLTVFENKKLDYSSCKEYFLDEKKKCHHFTSIDKNSLSLGSYHFFGILDELDNLENMDDTGNLGILE